MRKEGCATRYPGVSRIGPNLYRVRAKLIDPRTGKAKDVDREVTAASPKQAAAIREEMRRQKVLVLVAGVEPATRLRLGEFAKRWSERKHHELKPSTRDRYATALEDHILPRLGDFFVDALQTADVAAWRDAQIKSGYKPSTVNSRLRVLRTLLRDATNELDLAKNPASGVRSIREVVPDEDPNRLTRDELTRVLEAIRELPLNDKDKNGNTKRAMSPDWYPLFLTLASTGARFGEVTALRWEDIDTDVGVIRIRRAQWQGLINTTKTNRTRTVPLVPELAEALRDHRKRLIERQAKGLAEGWVFPGEKGTLRSTASLRAPLHAALKAAKIDRRQTVHGLRRTFNNLVRQFASGEVVRSMTGHVTERMTEHYSHVEIEEKRAAVTAALRLTAFEGAGGDGGGDAR